MTRPPRTAGTIVVVVHAGDRAWRTSVDVALREVGVRTRLSSRPAELAKSLADGLAQVIISGPATADGAMVTAARATVPVLTTTPDDTTAEIVRRALEMGAAVTLHADGRQVTSSE